MTAPSPEGRSRRATALVLLTVLTCTGTGHGADDAANPPTQPSVAQGSDAAPSAAERIPWLEEVRAQRQAVEARRQANRAAFAAQREAREDRREALRARLDQDWAGLQALRPPLADPRFPQRSVIVPSAPITAPAVAAPTTPPDWNNLWYYRGY